MRSKRIWYGIPSRPPFRENPEIKFMDRVVGDDRYVFLSLVPHRHNMAVLPERFERTRDLWRTWGFGFDAEDLIRRGAVVGKDDLLQGYERLVRETLRDVLLGHFPVDMDWKIESFVRDHLPTDLIPYLMSYGGMPEFLERIRAFHAEKRMTGESALDYVQRLHRACLEVMERDPKNVYDPACSITSVYADTEILWPGPLSVRGAVYRIENGRVVSVRIERTELWTT